jgi:hypothetical protein
VPDAPLVTRTGELAQTMVDSAVVQPAASTALDELLRALKVIADADGTATSGFRDALASVAALRAASDQTPQVSTALIRLADDHVTALHDETTRGLAELHEGLSEEFVRTIDPDDKIEDAMERLVIDRYRAIGGNPDDL